MPGQSVLDFGEISRAASDTPEDSCQIQISLWMALPLLVLGALVLGIGLYPGPWLELAAGAGVDLVAPYNDVLGSVQGALVEGLGR